MCRGTRFRPTLRCLVGVEAGVALVHFGEPGGPGGKGKFNGERDGDRGLVDEHRPRLGDGRSNPLPGGEESVFRPRGFGGVETADHLDGAVADDPPLDLAGGLLGADQDDSE